MCNNILYKLIEYLQSFTALLSTDDILHDTKSSNDDHSQDVSGDTPEWEYWRDDVR